MASPDERSVFPQSRTGVDGGLARTVAERLRAAIQDGSLPPGTRLVERGQRGDVAVLCRLDHPPCDAAQIALRRGAPALLRPAHDELLEHGAERLQLGERTGVELCNAGAAARRALDEPLLDQPRERLSDRNVTRAELRCQPPLDEAGSGRQRPVVNRGAKPFCHRA